MKSTTAIPAHKPLAVAHLLGVATVVLTACCPGVFAPKGGYAVDASSSWSPSAPRAGAPEVLLIADTHASNPMAPNQLISQAPLIDYWVSKTARRPPQMDAWGGRILEWLLARADEGQLVIHLGDAANISCLSEMDSFQRIMRADPYQREWYVAPGNHDSLLMGNYALNDNSDLKDGTWNGECSNDVDVWPGRTGAEYMNKIGFLRAYAAAKGWPAPALDACTDVPSDKLAGTRLRRARICLGPEQSAYVSYMLQEVEVDETTSMILLDTTQPNQMPQLFTVRHFFRKLFSWGTLPMAPLGGVIGGIRLDQRDELERWLDDDAQRGRTVILAGHLPIDALEREAQDWLADLIGTHPIAGYLSAHTHAPTNVRVHRPASEGAAGFFELNVGSLLDWPMQYAALSVTRGADSRVALDVTVGSAAVGLAGTCTPPGWRAEATAAYLGYSRHNLFEEALLRRQSEEYARVRDAMYQQLGTRFPAAPANFAQRELVMGESPAAILGEPALANEVVRYERCQVMWASEVEASDTHTPGLGKDPALPPQVVRHDLDLAGNEKATWTFSLVPPGGAP
jgi:3',5'-cyclic AMP phosphodiesterase CpdA